MYIPLEHLTDQIAAVISSGADHLPNFVTAAAADSATRWKDKWASPVAYGFYLGAIFVLMVLYYEWAWTRKCRNFVRVLVVKHDGTTETEYAPKQGAYVSLKQKDSATLKLWPINELATVEMLYPGDGFIPDFLQKKIRMVIVSEADWEPLLNRGAYNELVASPDVVEKLKLLAEYMKTNDADLANEIDTYADTLTTAPTRDMIASPALLGNLVKEKVSEMVVAIASESLDKLDNIIRKLEKVPNAWVLYIMVGAAVLFSLIAMIKVLTISGGGAHQMEEIKTGVQMLQQHFGLLPTPTPGGQ